MQMRQRDVTCLMQKYMKELADAKAENDAQRDDVAAGRRRLHIKAVCRRVKPPPPPAWIMQPPRLADTAERGLFHPQREADHFAKTTGRNSGRSILMSSVDRVAYRWANRRNYCEQGYRASSGV